MKKIVITTAVAAIALTGCGAADTVTRAAVQQVTPWEDTLREYLDVEFTGAATSDAELAEMCLALTMFDIETPEQVGALVFAFDEGDELPPAHLTLGEWADQEGEFLPINLPKDVTVREVVNEAGAYVLDMCGVAYE